MALDKDTLKDAIEDALGGDDPAKIAEEVNNKKLMILKNGV